MRIEGDGGITYHYLLVPQAVGAGGDLLLPLLPLLLCYSPSSCGGEANDLGRNA